MVYDINEKIIIFASMNKTHQIDEQFHKFNDFIHEFYEFFYYCNEFLSSPKNDDWKRQRQKILDRKNSKLESEFAL